MAPHSRLLPSFYKILLDRLSPHLALPAGFVRKHLENNIPDNPILRSVNGGYSWNLKIKKEGEVYCFADGWNDVVEDSQLGFGDFLVFWLVDQCTFKISIFSPNGCERNFPPKIQVQISEQEEEEEEEDDDAGDENEEDPFFVKIIPKRVKYYLRFPKEFARLAGLKKERMIKMKNVDGMEWSMSLVSEIIPYKRQGYKRYFLSQGWNDFRKVNQLCEGDECHIKYIRTQDKLCLARVIKKIPPVAAVLKRKRGRPPREEVVKRSRGRPKKRKRGRPAGVKLIERFEMDQL